MCLSTVPDKPGSADAASVGRLKPQRLETFLRNCESRSPPVCHEGVVTDLVPALRLCGRFVNATDVRQEADRQQDGLSRFFFSIPRRLKDASVCIFFLHFLSFFGGASF